MSNRVRTKKRAGRDIVRAWFDTVINPSLAGLRIEREYLEKRNWTWRFQSGRLESIRPIQSLTGYMSVDNLELFTEFYPQIKNIMDEHDNKVERLSTACENLHRILADSPLLLDLYQRLTSPASLAKLKPAYPKQAVTIEDLFSSMPERRHLEFLAEYILNNTGELPDYYTPSRLWNMYRNEFMDILNKPVIRDYNQKVVDAGESLLKTNSDLIQLLKKTRFELALEHDVPYVSANQVFAE